MSMSYGTIMRRNRPLAIVLEKGELQITIGINALAKFFNAQEKVRAIYNDPEDPPQAEVRDAQAFAWEVIHELERIDEDGMNFVDKLLADACDRAASRGAVGLAIVGEKV
jgi:hypothetical protein